METFSENMIKAFYGSLSQIHSHEEIETIKPPQTLCLECLNSKSKIIPNFLVICYCSHTRTGGFYNFKDQRWQILTPISQEEFDANVQETLGLCNELFGKVLNKVIEESPGKET